MDSSTYLAIIVLALLSGMTTLIGVWLAYRIKNKSYLIVVGIGFSTGIMILISFFELFPEAIDEAGWTKAILTGIIGFGFSAILNYIIPHTHLIKEREGANRPIIAAAYLLAFGLILHDVPEGFAMANSFVNSPSLGIMVAIAIALHNIPEEFAMAVPLITAGKNKKSLIKIAIVSGLAEPVGAVIGLLAVSFFTGLNAYMLAFSAGIMVYISIHELLPMAHKYRKPIYLTTGLLASVLVFIILAIAFPE
ncbi:MAG: ZIP family metal transporter [Candidatus Kerfeldbacteria bacterium]